jgi:hypothetical protein
MVCALVAILVVGCGGRTMETPSYTLQRDVAMRFAAAVVSGDAHGARALLVRSDEAALAFLVGRAAARWRIQHASLRLPGRRVGNRWTFRYAGIRTYRDGTFETETGDLVVFVTQTRGGAAVRFFALDHVRTRFSTHHDARLLPSKR